MWGFGPLMEPSGHFVPSWNPVGGFGPLMKPCGCLVPPWSPVGLWDPHGAMLGVFPACVVHWKGFEVLHAVREFVSLRALCEVWGPSWTLAHLLCWCLMLVFQQRKGAEQDGAFPAGAGVRIGSGPEALWVQS